MEPRWSGLGKERLNNGPGKQECQRLARQRGLRPQIGFSEGGSSQRKGRRLRGVSSPKPLRSRLMTRDGLSIRSFLSAVKRNRRRKFLSVTSIEHVMSNSCRAKPSRGPRRSPPSFFSRQAIAGGRIAPHEKSRPLLIRRDPSAKEFENGLSIFYQPHRTTLTIR